MRILMVLGFSTSLALIASCSSNPTPADQTIVSDLSMVVTGGDMATATTGDMTKLVTVDMSTAPKNVPVTVAAGGAMAFSPANAIAKVGDTVVWTFGSAGHTVTSTATAVTQAACTADTSYCSQGAG